MNVDRRHLFLLLKCGWVPVAILLVGDDVAIVVLAAVVPDLLTAEAEWWVGVGFVPKDLVLYAIALGVVVDDDAFVILCALIHDGTEDFKGRKHAGITVVKSSAILYDVFAKYKNVVDICPQIWRNSQRILHSNDKKQFEVAPVHEK